MDLLEDLIMQIQFQDLGVSFCWEGDVGHIYKCQLNEGQEMSLSIHFKH